MAKWRIKQRANPIGGLALSCILHLGGTEGILVLAVVVTIFMQFRRKAVRLLDRLLMDNSAGCFDLSCSASGVNWARATFFLLLILLLGVTLWNSRSIRRFVFQFLIPFIGLIAAAIFAFAFFTHQYSLWLFAVLVLIKAAVLAYCFFEIEWVGDAPISTIPDAASSSVANRFEGSRALHVAWLSMLAFGLVLWLSDPGPGFGPRLPCSADTSWSESFELAAGTQVWIGAIESKNTEAVRALAVSSEATKIFSDPIWGKQVFFMATDSSPAVLEAVLEGVVLPEEFVEHSFARLSSQGNCRAFNRLILYAKQRQLSINGAVGSVCREKPVRDHT